MASLFANAQVIPAKTAKAKAVASTIPVIGIKTYAQLDAAEKAIKALKETFRPIIDSQLTDIFIESGIKSEKRPDNFRASEGFKYSASAELRKRSTASALNPTEEAICKEYGIPTEIVEDRPEAFIFNPAYLNDSAMLEKISAALSKVKGLPEDLIMKQESTKKTVLSENALDVVFKLAKVKVCKLFSIVGTLALKPKIENIDIVEVFADISAIVAQAEEEKNDDE